MRLPGAAPDRAAQHLRRERKGHTLQPTALVSEAYLRLAQRSGTPWQDRTHFFAVAAHVVRAVLVDHARARLAAKRGANPVVVELQESSAQVPAPPVDLLDLDAALTPVPVKFSLGGDYGLAPALRRRHRSLND